MERIKVSIVGGSGYVGGELLRLLLFHQGVEVCQVSSERFAGKPVVFNHPNLKGVTKLQYCTQSEIAPCDVLFLCLPHGSSSRLISRFESLADKIIDLSADFRFDAESFVYGIPELHREAMKGATGVASAGCNATATILALYPLFRQGLVEPGRSVVEVKVGSSEGGNGLNEASHHPERAGAVRSFKPTGHRHGKEIECQLRMNESVKVHFSATAIEMVRGVLATCHVFLKESMTEKQLWGIYRDAYAKEPFIRLVKATKGIHRYPEPKYVMGTNYCDIGFEKDEGSNRLVVLSAIDNLMKGAAGQAIQAFNIMHDYEETMGLEFPGLHPV